VNASRWSCARRRSWVEVIERAESLFPRAFAGLNSTTANGLHKSLTCAPEAAATAEEHRAGLARG
jgi:hypothetical protein